jgi:hypothetical protein
MEFLILLFAHLIADYPLQGEFLANMKGKNLIVLFSHAGIWTGCIAIAGYLLGYDVGYMDIAFLFIVHALLDYQKANKRGIYEGLDTLKSGLLLDQFMHVLQIVVFIAMH